MNKIINSGRRADTAAAVALLNDEMSTLNAETIQENRFLWVQFSVSHVII